MSLTPVSVLSNQLRDLVYAPVTDWRNFWSGFFRPMVNFGCNIKDIRTESDVLHEVGSYGHQINRLLDAVAVLVDLELGDQVMLTSDQVLALLELKKLATDAHVASERSEALQATAR
jgi:hypothetical protein